MRLLLSIVVAGVACNTAALADSYWDHNGSLMRLRASGDERVFEYVNPSETMVAAGVRPGTVLFTGVRRGDRYEGVARVFSRWCTAELEYAVAGRVVSETEVSLAGEREVYREGCVPTGRTTTDLLTFTYRYRD